MCAGLREGCRELTSLLSSLPLFRGGGCSRAGHPGHDLILYLGAKGVTLEIHGCRGKGLGYAMLLMVHWNPPSPRGFFFIWAVVSACLHPGGCIGPSVGSALSKLHGDTAQAAGPGRGSGAHGVSNSFPPGLGRASGGPGAAPLVRDRGRA